MESMGIVQARTPESVKENATNILEKLGLNMSTYINMALNQLIIQEGIPFAVKLAKSSYTDEEKIKEVAATLRMEGLKLSDSDLSMLQKIHGVTAVKEVKKLDFDQRISASIHNHHH